MDTSRTRVLTVILAGMLALPIAAAANHARHPAPAETTCPVSVHYSSHGGAAVAIVQVLDRAQQTIHVAAYGLNHPSLVNALAEARQRGVAVSVKADKVQSASDTQRAALAQLAEAGVAVEVSTQSRLLHDKFAVVDGRWVVTGSFNWTGPAENRNRENLVVFDCPALAASYAAECETIRPDEP